MRKVSLERGKITLVLKVTTPLKSVILTKKSDRHKKAPPWLRKTSSTFKKFPSVKIDTEIFKSGRQPSKIIATKRNLHFTHHTP